MRIARAPFLPNNGLRTLLRSSKFPRSSPPLFPFPTPSLRSSSQTIQIGTNFRRFDASVRDLHFTALQNSFFSSLCRAKHTVDFVMCAPVVGGDVFAGRGRAARVSSRRCARLFSTAAAASDDAPSVRRSVKRVSKQERRVLVESFVNKYRNLNAGKFPTASVAQKEVGGGYYVIREILQELQYNAVHSPATEINGKSLVEKKGVEKEDRPQEEFSQGEELSSSHSQADREVERQLYEVEKVPHAEEKACKKNMEVLGDKVEAEVEKAVDAEAQRESTGVKEVYGQPLSRDFVSRTDDVSTDQKLVCEEAERNSSTEHANNLWNDEVKKHSESRKTLDVGSFSEKTLLEDTLNPRSKEDKDEFQVTSSSLQAEGSSTMPRTGEPALVHEEAAKSASYDGSREPPVDSANDNDLQDKPSLWSNLKSFADSVFSIWRKR